jgi:DNA (cytosine-5)-methyltransferase 1
VDETVAIPEYLIDDPTQPWHPDALHAAYSGLSDQAKDGWVWWNLPQPSKRKTKFVDLIESEPTCVTWHTESETGRLLSMMTPLNRRKVDIAEKVSSIMASPVVGGIYRRTREGVQRAEVRFDDISGCLRTPGGGSSRQSIIVIESGNSRTRLLSPREAARLMGLPDSYILPKNYNQAYHLCGDGVVVPAVEFLNKNLIWPIISKGFGVRSSSVGSH